MPSAQEKTSFSESSEMPSAQEIITEKNELKCLIPKTKIEALMTHNDYDDFTIQYFREDDFYSPKLIR